MPGFKILEIITRLGAGGPPLHVISLARELERYGHETLVATGSCSSQDGDMSYLLQASDQVSWIPAMSRSVALVSDFLALMQLIRLARSYKPDIVHTHTAKAGVLGRIAAWLSGAPVVIHTYHGNVLRGYFSPASNWCIRKLEQLMSRITHAVCVLSEQQRREICHLFQIAPAERTHVIPLGLDVSAFGAIHAPPLQSEMLTVGWLGRLVPIKNIPLLTAIVERSIQAISGIRFIIAGDGPDRPLIDNLVRQFGSDRISYVGWQRDVLPVIEQCDVLIQTSRNEGTPVALIQGMAAARPFVSTAVGGLEDMVTGEERVSSGFARWFDNAVLLPPDPEAFVTALDELSRNRHLLRSMGLSARQYAFQTHSEEHMLNSMHKLYSDLLETKKPARYRSGRAQLTTP